MSRRTGMLTLIFILGIVFTAAASVGAIFVSLSSHRVIPNVYAGEVNLGGMTREEGILKLKQFFQQLEKETLTLKYGNQSWTLPLKTIGVTIDEDTVMDRALRVGHNGPIWKRWNESLHARKEGMHIPLAIKVNRDKLRKEVDNLLADITRPPVDAAFHITSQDEIKIIPGRKGVKVDHTSLHKNLLHLLASGTKPLQLEVSLLNVPPSRTVEDIRAMGINGLLSSYSTRFDPNQAGRTYNIRVAAAALDGLLVPPGKEVSFNKIVGPRSSEAGYKNAKVILNNELVDGLGGGVCQVSTTLYNAVLLADLTVTERSNHSLPVNYVPIGRDATVAYNYLDFRFRNSTDSYILVKSTVGYNTITIKIYGNTENKKDVSIKSWVTRVLEPGVVYEEDPNLAKGEKVIKQKGVKGYKTSGIIEITKNGKTITRPLPKSLYPPRDEIIAIGTKETNITIDIQPDIPAKEGEIQVTLPVESPHEEDSGEENPCENVSEENNVKKDPVGEGKEPSENGTESGKVQEATRGQGQEAEEVEFEHTGSRQ